MKEFKGIVAAMATPMYPDESVNYEELGNQIERHIAAGMDGIFCLGTNGEAYALNPREKEKIIALTVEKCAGRIPVYAGTGCVTTAETVRLTTRAKELGADVCSVICPYFAASSQEGLYRHYSTLNDECGIPIIIYNMPARTGVNISHKTVSRLAKQENIVGVKDSSGNFDTILRFLEETDRDQFAVFSGNDSLILWTLMAGGAGGISGIANILPRTMTSIYDAWASGNFEEAKRIQDSIRPIRDCLGLGNPNSVVKRAASLLGHNLGPARAPFDILADNADEVLRQTLALYSDTDSPRIL